MKPFTKGIAAGLGVGVLLILLLTLYTFTAGSLEDSGQAQVPEETDIQEEPSSLEEELEDIPEETEEPEPEEPAPEEEIPEEPQPSEVVFSFAGDVMFSDHYTSAYDQNGISAIADAEMLAAMQDSDLFMLNEEFPFSFQGDPMEDKQYTFRTDPRYVSIFQDLGVDMVSVANNHALDFGQAAFCDTLETLKQADIACLGGGYQITEASAPGIFEVNGQTFAVFAATRVSPSYDWYATDSQPGMFQTYDPSRLNAAIAEADGRYDHVIVFVHWGIERNEYPEDYQHALAKGYIDTGAIWFWAAIPTSCRASNIIKTCPSYTALEITFSAAGMATPCCCRQSLQRMAPWRSGFFHAEGRTASCPPLRTPPPCTGT